MRKNYCSITLSKKLEMKSQAAEMNTRNLTLYFQTPTPENRTLNFKI